MEEEFSCIPNTTACFGRQHSSEPQKSQHQSDVKYKLNIKDPVFMYALPRDRKMR